MDNQRSWYLIQTKPRQEHIALINLERQNYTAYLPYVSVNKRKHGKYQQVSAPMFSRYLFIKLNRETDDWGPIRSTRGVSGIVRFGGVAATVPKGLVELIRQREHEFSNHKDQSSNFKIGDNVRIADGIMQGYEGIISEKSNKKRVTILLNMMGKEAKIELPLDAVVLN